MNDLTLVQDGLRGHQKEHGNETGMEKNVTEGKDITGKQFED